MATKDKKKNLTAEERQQYDEWKAQHQDKQLSKSDKAIIQMASNGIVNAITTKAATAFLILYSTYQRNFHFVDAGEIRMESVQIAECTKQAKKVGVFDFHVSKNKCKYIFRLLGCEIEVTYKKDPNFLEE